LFGFTESEKTRSRLGFKKCQMHRHSTGTHARHGTDRDTETHTAQESGRWKVRLTGRPDINFKHHTLGAAVDSTNDNKYLRYMEAHGGGHSS